MSSADLDSNKLEFRPLREADTDDLHSLLNDARVTRHMPLAEPVDRAWIENWKESKSQQWPAPEHGPWAVYLDGRFAGWSGVQPDGEDEDELAIVLHVWAWNLGREIARQTLSRFRSFGHSKPIAVYFPTTRPIQLLTEKLSLKPVGEAAIGEHRFVKLHLTDRSLA